MFEFAVVFQLCFFHRPVQSSWLRPGISASSYKYKYISIIWYITCSHFAKIQSIHILYLEVSMRLVTLSLERVCKFKIIGRR